MNRFILLLFIFGIISDETYGQEQTTKDSVNIDKMFEMSLDELLKVKVLSSSLTDIKDDLTPVPVITIDKSDILLSGARNLDELLEIYVPSFIMLYRATTNAIGIRGLINNNNTKLLLLVNGSIINDRTVNGAISERNMTMLADIDRIEVIQSPQSSLYGPGAISGVISIYTKSGITEGPSNEVSINQGAIDVFTNVQIRHSNTLKNDLSYSVYYGIDHANGVSNANSPIKFSINTVDGNGDTIIANKAISYEHSNLNSSDDLRHKFHAQVNYKNFKSWIRYTQGGGNFSTTQHFIMSQTSEVSDRVYTNYGHLTFFNEYNKTIGNWKNRWQVKF